MIHEIIQRNSNLEMKAKTDFKTYRPIEVSRIKPIGLTTGSVYLVLHSHKYSLRHRQVHFTML